ncbi:MAG: hypothetical protein ACK5L1_03785 [Pseudanabaena sp.]|jgi:hypothetical protein
MPYRLEETGTFEGLSPSSNPEYLTAKFKLPELYNGTLIPIDSMVNPNVSMVLSSKSPQLELIKGLTLNAKYRLLFSVEVDQPNGKYGAKVRLVLHAAKPLEETKQKELAKAA